ncbi:MAG: hypothetical protein AB2809_20005 [Candidatus Thiodiazotropha sp.]
MLVLVKLLLVASTFLWGMSFASSACDVGDIRFTEEFCKRISSELISEDIGAVEIEFETLAQKKSKYTCELYKLIKERRSGIRRAGDENNDEIEEIISLGKAKSAYFARGAEEGVSLLLMKIRPLQCEKDEGATYLIATSTRMDILHLDDSCEPLRVNLVLRLNDYCDGQFDIALLQGAYSLSDIYSSKSERLRLWKSTIEVPVSADQIEREYKILRNREMDLQDR